MLKALLCVLSVLSGSSGGVYAGSATSQLDKILDRQSQAGSLEKQAVNARFEMSLGQSAVTPVHAPAPARRHAWDGKDPNTIDPQSVPLSEKAQFFQERTDRENRPWLGLILSRRLDEQGNFAHYDNYGDSLIWTGNYVASQAYRYAVTHDEDALKRMEESLWGLHADMMATGVPGLPARVVVPKSEAVRQGFGLGGGHREGAGNLKDYVWEGDNSMDSYTGYMRGISTAFPYIRDPKLKDAIREDMRQFGLHMMRNNMRMVGPDTFLDFRANYYYQDRFPSSMNFLKGLPLPPWRAGNSIHGLHLMKVASEVSGDPRLKAYYEQEMILNQELDLKVKDSPSLDEIIAKHQGAFTKVMRAYTGEDVTATVQSLRTDIGLDLDHQSLHDLIRLEGDPLLQKEYRDALTREHATARGEGNSYWNFEYASVVPGQEKEVADGVATLHHFPLRTHARPVHNSDDPAYPKYKGLQGENLLPWKWFTDKPLPFEKRNFGGAWTWQNNPYELDGGDPVTDQGSGTDYLVAYWMGRYYGFIKPNE